jgi:hypothetical protein
MVWRGGGASTPYYPCFPNTDRTQPPQHGEKPTPGGAEWWAREGTALLDDTIEGQCITERAGAVMVQQDDRAAAPAPAKLTCTEQPWKLWRMFTRFRKAS